MRDIPLASVDDAERAAAGRGCAWCEDWADGFDPEPCPRHNPDESRGLWIGAVLVAVVAVAALVVGWWARGAWG